MYLFDKNEFVFKCYSQYLKYVMIYYVSEEKDVYYVILNFLVLIVDDIIIENF